MITPVRVLKFATLPSVPVQLIVSPWVMLMVPKLPGSTQLTSPPSAVFSMAESKSLHGASRVHGLRSLPSLDTQVRLNNTWACAGAAATGSESAQEAATQNASGTSRFCIGTLL